MILRECEVRYSRTKIDAPGTWPKRVTSSRHVVSMLQSAIGDLPTERFVAVLLDAKNKPLGLVTCAQGGTASCVLSPADVFRPALVAGAVAMIVAHNHPSGDPTPSQDDLVLTARIVQAAEIIGIKILDHVVICETDSWSFLDHGVMPTGKP